MAESNADYATVIGPDAKFKGELSFEKGVRLLGRFEGQIASKGDLLVAEGASLQGEVEAGNVRIDGDVQGNLKASGKIHLSASSKLEGDLETARLEVADGAVFIGRCVVGANGSPRSGGSGGSKPGSAASSSPPQQAKPQSEPQPAGKK